MTASREDIELYVTGNYDGDADALERAIAEDPVLRAILAEEAHLEELLRDAAMAATFCVACHEIVREDRCNECGVAVRPGGYLVERVLVANAHGRMYVARDTDGKRVALKELAFVNAPSASALAAFEREAKFLQALEHPSIPRFVAAFEEGSGVHTRYYLAQELVEGDALDRIEDHWYSEPEIVDIATKVLGILVYLQSLSPMIIHRDIKPANLLKRPDGSIALVDFGAAHVYGSTAGSTTIGTFGYMPVEQLAGIVDATTDVFALGATLLNLLTREEPWKLAQTNMAVNVSAAMRVFLDKATAADPRERFPSAKDALAALENRDALVVAPKASRERWRRRRLLPLAIASATALAAGGGVAAFHALSADDDPEVGYVHVIAGTQDQFTFSVDGEMWGNASYDTTIRLNPGLHKIKLVGERGETCSAEVRIRSGLTESLECVLPKGKTPAGLKLGTDVTPPLDLPTHVTLSQSTPAELDEVIGELAKSCSINFVMRSRVGQGDTPRRAVPDVVIDAHDIRCDEAITGLLQSRGLSYFYNPTAQLIRIGRSEGLFSTAAPDAFKGQLPAGNSISLDVMNVEVRTVLEQIARGSRIHLVIPNDIRGRVTAHLKDVPWDQAFEAVLESQGLWYRYREDSNTVTVLVNLNVGAPPNERFERYRTEGGP
jgi:serine/threonine protein kinase